MLSPAKNSASTSEVRCRKEANCTLGKLQLVLPAKAEQTASATDANASQKFKVVINESVPPPNIWQQQQPEPPPLAVARQETSIEGYNFTADQPVTHIAATSTRIDRIAIRMVPAYTLAVEPDQAIELLARPKKPFDILLRVHSYATKPRKSMLASPRRKVGRWARRLRFNFPASAISTRN